MKTWKQCSRGILLLMVFCLSALAPLSVSAGELSAQYKNKIATDGGYESLVLQADSSGSIRIIVKVEAAFQPVGSLSVAEAEEQARSISRAQDQVMGQLTSVNVFSHYKYQYIPHIAMTVDRNALDAVLAITEVISVEEDKLASPTQVNWDISKVGAPAAWSSGYDGTGYVVAILDTGVDNTHPILTGKVVSEACYSTTDSSSSSSSLCPGGVTSSTSSGCAMPYAGSCPSGKCDHGTHVAGSAAGQNTGQSSGVAKGANIIAIQIFSLFNSSSYCTTTPCVLTWDSDQIKGLERVYALKGTYSIAAANLSIGSGKYTSNCDSQNSGMKAAIDNLRSSGIATVIAAGNDKYTDGLNSPGCISTAVSVGATDSSDAVASYSNSASFLNLLAPGSSILSSIPNGGYGTWNGTSMATPHVAGAWAVLKQAKPSASVADLLNALISTGVSITDSRNGITKPRIQVDAALNSLTSGYSITVTKSGTGTGTITSKPAGISCGSTCSSTFSSGAGVYLIAAADSGSTFSGFTGCDTSYGNGCYLLMSSAKNVTATFTKSTTYAVSVTKSGTGTGTITSKPAGISCGSTCSSSFTSGSGVYLTAAADAGSTFTGFTGCDTANSNGCYLSMSSAKSVTAAFTSSGTSDFNLASDAINAFYNQYPSYFGTKSGGITTGSDASGTYYIQWFTNGRAIIAWTDGYLYWWDGSSWTSYSVWNPAISASAWINWIYNKHASYFGTKSGGIISGTNSSGTYYIQWFINGRAIIAWTDGYMWYWDGSATYNLGYTWK
ncbi:S8 family serine peptidase [Candidatus Magnetominusculus xianensis]|uniref:Peptidase S8 and S53 subtilisin kexin sedolisin n=1 Tax=Candidatus Magnetominusculus xianensis TaxID=1748249 RepID=A0ABR5SJK2_9BACT|nr:S8 family serine peptidase [Candidatus Magnetominusculus xianensis]KWT94643.1 peptidase S8 and S53 subtilisin kexin sedolisin [Candidatus Magnetominusculus xianensis]MBF0403355.1 S8 family serine peptidase [Nitrospirota bacterium]